MNFDLKLNYNLYIKSTSLFKIWKKFLKKITIGKIIKYSNIYYFLT